MLQSLFEQLKTSTGFTDEDDQRLRRAFPRLHDDLERVIDVFYERLGRDPVARNLLEGPEQIERLKQSLNRWLVTLFRDPKDAKYLEIRSRIGRRHVEIHMPQYLMIVSMNTVRETLHKLIASHEIPEALELRISIDKLLDIELAMMLETYRQDYLERITAAERREMEARLKESQQMASVGRLAASLAHEIKNPLAGISGAIQVIRQTGRLDAAHREVLDEVLKQINRLDNAVKDLLVYARPTPPSLRLHRIGDLVNHACLIVREEPSLREMDIEFMEDSAHLEVRADETQLQQVLINLLLNASHASGGEGRIEIHCRRLNGDLELVVRDFGEGISADVRDRVFEPFFTTKARGTGLGLAICSKIMESHRGRISIESTPGRGTEVRLRLPMSSEDGPQTD